MRFTSFAPLVATLSAVLLACGAGQDDHLGTVSSALSAPATIRIGVVPSASSVSVGGTGAFDVRDTAGATLLSGNAQTATVTIDSLPTTTQSRRLQVTCTSNTTTRDSKLQAGRDAGYSVYTVWADTAGCWRVYIGERPLPIDSTLEAQLKTEIVNKGLSTTDAYWATVTVTTGETRYKVVLNGVEATTTAPVRVVAITGFVTIGGRQYRGQAEVRVNSTNTLAGINELAFEQYLYGVVPRELGPIQYPFLEALKAQAVAARTYALRNLGKRSKDGYDLLATTSDQVYGGAQDEHSLSTQAVNETAGVAATYGGGYVDALYHSTSGGWTADNEEVYNSSAIAYLRGSPDREMGAAAEDKATLDSFRNAANPKSLRATREGDFESDWAPLHRWTFEWTADEIRRVVSAFAGKDVGRVLAINVTDRGSSSRALRIEYVTDAGTFVDTKDRIRASLKFVNSSGALQNLPSTLFFIEAKVDSNTNEVTGFVAYGGGFGHGVGMSQTGAVGMADRGALYQEILAHYYTGVELMKL